MTSPKSQVLKVIVSVSGEITAAGESITLAQLGSRLASLRQAHGMVWYHRQDPSAREPHPNAMKVIEMVVQNSLPVRLSARADFSDVVDDKGNSSTGGK